MALYCVSEVVAMLDDNIDRDFEGVDSSNDDLVMDTEDEEDLEAPVMQAADTDFFPSEGIINKVCNRHYNETVLDGLMETHDELQSEELEYPSSVPSSVEDSSVEGPESEDSDRPRSIRRGGRGRGGRGRGRGGRGSGRVGGGRGRGRGGGGRGRGGGGRGRGGRGRGRGGRTFEEDEWGEYL